MDETKPETWTFHFCKVNLKEFIYKIKIKIRVENMLVVTNQQDRISMDGACRHIRFDA